jgi:hypothetical protein
MVPQSTHTKHSILRCFQLKLILYSHVKHIQFHLRMFRAYFATCKLIYPMTHMRRLGVTNKLSYSLRVGMIVMMTMTMAMTMKLKVLTMTVS